MTLASTALRTTGTHNTTATLVTSFRALQPSLSVRIHAERTEPPAARGTTGAAAALNEDDEDDDVAGAAADATSVALPRTLPDVQQSGRAQARLLTELQSAKQQLVNLVSASLLREPNLYDADDPTRALLMDMVATMAVADPEFVLRIALYCRDDLNIRITGARGTDAAHAACKALTDNVGVGRTSQLSAGAGGTAPGDAAIPGQVPWRDGAPTLGLDGRGRAVPHVCRL
jgi:hypothetical protein